MNKTDLLKEIRLKRAGILAIHYRKKIDIKDLDYHVKLVIDSLEMYMNMNAGKEGIKLRDILNEVSNLKNATAKLQKLERYLASEKCKAFFDESKKASVNAIDEILIVL